ncbi:Conserved_hypothetical protein [Hexamita inflata]|uniref:Uncharacterized protein n=1 Tax=Hexamita inflata TaxID=28002 RepID=A0AA86PUA4_9EUKA|nr:Conserved hypothetical protein [Hexamita inflata]
MNNLLSSCNTYQLKQKVDNIENVLIVIDDVIFNNVTELENRIISNFSKSEFNLQLNTSILDNRIYENISQIQNEISAVQMKAEANLLSNTTVLDWRIYNNISIFNNSIKILNQNLSLRLNNVDDSILKQAQIIDQQLNLINNLTQQINCTSNYGYSMINGSCVQVTCAISGQQSINGICQCMNINSVVQAGSCVCPVNAQIIGTACVCTFSGQTMQNGACSCSTTGAFVDNGVCTCGVNGINISNTCSCPSGANLLNGVCTCTNINAYISGNQCICPTYSSLIGSTCTCPTNSQIENNQCVCNLISGQILNNDGICQCQTIGAFVKNGACVCGQNALNVSNTCICPVNSSLINQVCVCDQIIGSQIITGICQCPSGLSVVNNSCQQIRYYINLTNLQCSQDIFIQSYDIQSITNQINSSSNFTAGYVFSSTNTIYNAFIDISDNVYSSTIYPLFQSQYIFTNLKIQFGTQNVNGGSFIISTSTSVSINLLNIISRSGSQLIINSSKFLNILMAESTNANITNLLVNFTFAPSYGNITLINNINGICNISGYQVLGTYISTSTTTMIGQRVNTATVTVNKFCFKPNAYNVGNGSSYLFGQAIITTSIFSINNIAIIVGYSSNILLLGSISTTNYNSNYYMFGGIITHVNSNSTVSINNVILDSYQKFSSSYVSYSGFLIGYVQAISSIISLSNVCLQQNVTSTTQQIYWFGIMGYISFGWSESISQISYLKNCFKLGKREHIVQAVNEISKSLQQLLNYQKISQIFTICSNDYFVQLYNINLNNNIRTLQTTLLFNDNFII